MTVFVKIKHDETGAVGTCPEGALGHWLGRGYSRADEDAEISTGTQEDTEFDPSARTAKEVRSYLSGLDPESTEYERVFTAEAEGENRATAFPS